MKRLIGILLTGWLLAACGNTGSGEPAVDTSSSSDISKEERTRQIDRAKNNRTLIVGKWQLTDARQENAQMTPIRLDEMNFDVIQFTPDHFTAYLQQQAVSEGTYEWMAEDREMVLTHTDESVQRMLLKNISHQQIRLKFNGAYLRFKKIG